MQFKYNFTNVLFTSYGDMRLKWNDFYFMDNSHFFFLIPVSENDCCLVAKLYLTLCNPWTTAHQLPCLLLSPKVCSNSSPLYRWENHYFCLSRFLLGWPKYLFRFFFFFFHKIIPDELFGQSNISNSEVHCED